MSLLAAVLCAYPAHSQSGLPSHSAVQVRAVAVRQNSDGTAIEITSNGSLVPSITKLDGPPRLVIDLPETVNMVRRKIGPEAKDIRGVRINQFQQDPPVTRVVVDLVEPRSYAWETAQEKLVIHLRPLTASEATPTEQTSSVPAFTAGVEAVASTSNVAGNAAVMLAGNRIAPGSSVTAGEDTAVLNLSRGGQVKVCPGTTISVTTSQSGGELMLGMSTGAIETHYQIAASSDSILTPDFRILLSGPGEFHYAVGADSRGNTCVRALPGNESSAVVSELIGDGTYNVKPTEQVVFRAGQLSKADSDVPGDCGCPTQREPVLRAQAELPQSVSQTLSVSPEAPAHETQAPSSGAATQPVALSEVVPQPDTPTSAELQAPPPKGSKPHIYLQMPLVFRAGDPPPPPVRDARQLPTVSRRSVPELVRVTPPAKSAALPAPQVAPRQDKESRGFFGSIRHFFAKIFS